jgi:hypothetical protein
MNKFDFLNCIILFRNRNDIWTSFLKVIAEYYGTYDFEV